MRAFLSYSSQNAALARRVAEILRVRNVEVWFDQRDLRPGDPLASALISGLSAVDYFVVLVTEASAASNWMRFELDGALSRATGGGLRIIPLLFGNASVPDVLAPYKWIRCNDAADAGRAIDQALHAQRPSGGQRPAADSHPAPRFGIRLIPSGIFQHTGRLGTPERKYVLIGDYFEQWGRTLREVQESIFAGQYFDRINRATDGWTAVIFEIGEIHSKNYDVFPATWKSVYRILTDPRRLAMFAPTGEAMDALRRPPRDYRRSDGYPWAGSISVHIGIDRLEEIFGLYNGCFQGDDGVSTRGSQIFLVKNLELNSLNARVLDLGTPDEGNRVQ
jgi:TIR domain